MLYLAFREGAGTGSTHPRLVWVTLWRTRRPREFSQWTHGSESAPGRMNWKQLA